VKPRPGNDSCGTFREFFLMEDFRNPEAQFDVAVPRALLAVSCVKSLVCKKFRGTATRNEGNRVTARAKNV
jgi:hypothetical protein